MDTYTPIIVDGQKLYIANLNSSGLDKRGDFSFTSKALGDLLKPIVLVCKTLHEEIKNIQPDETELSLQLSIGVDNGNLFFGIANMSAEAQLAVKFVWKKDPSNSVSENKS